MYYPECQMRHAELCVSTVIYIRHHDSHSDKEKSSVSKISNKFLLYSGVSKDQLTENKYKC